jgi:hypothetical protein
MPSTPTFVFALHDESLHPDEFSTDTAMFDDLSSTDPSFEDRGKRKRDANDQMHLPILE